MVWSFQKSAALLKRIGKRRDRKSGNCCVHNFMKNGSQHCSSWWISIGEETDLQKKNIYDLYLASTAYINNWDLVDLSAQHIVGSYLDGKETSVLTRLALSRSLWERRIAILATFHFIGLGDSLEALRIAELLLRDPHDLIHKAVGWMLREVGKRCSLEAECEFLDAHAATMPRTMLRYAIERFPPKLRLHYLRRKRR